MDAKTVTATEAFYAEREKKNKAAAETASLEDQATHLKGEINKKLKEVPAGKVPPQPLPPPPAAPVAVVAAAAQPSPAKPAAPAKNIEL